jgi:hypothetical protein
MLLPVTNFVLFQIGWFACVLGSAYSYPWLGTLTAILIVTYHVLRSKYQGQEFMLIILAIAIGGSWDSFLVWVQWIDYNNGMWSENLAPHWIVALWALFATTLNVSLRWMKGRWLIAVLSGALAGPLAYYAGYRLGAVNFPDMITALFALGIGWAVFMPLLLLLSQRLDGYSYLSEPQKVTT